MERPRFLEELSRRHVYKVAAVYAVVAWVAIQIAATALPYLLDRPDPVIRIIIILSLVGFPIALVLGWIFDVTPEGVQRTDAQPVVRTPVTQPAPTRNRARIVAVGSLFVAAVAVGFALWYVRENTARPAPQSSPEAFGAEIQRQVQEQLRGVTHPADTTLASRAAGAHGIPDMDSIVNVVGAAMSSLSGLIHAQGPVPANMKRIAVFPFRVSGSSGDATWGRTTADSLGAALSGSGFEAVDAAAVRKATDAAGPDPDDRPAYAAIARELGADAFITGVVIPQSGSVVLEMALSGVDAPGTIRSATGVVPANGLGTALKRLVSRLTARDAGAP